MFLKGLNLRRLCIFFSEENERISASIRHNLGAHTTTLRGDANEQGEAETLVYVAVSKQQLFYLKKS